MKYRIIARIENDNISSDLETNLVGYVVADDKCNTHTATLSQIYKLYKQGKIEGAEFDSNGEVNLKGIDNKLLPFLNLSAIKYEHPFYMIMGERKFYNSRSAFIMYMVNTTIKSEAMPRAFTSQDIITGLYRDDFRIGNARVTRNSIEFRDTLVVLGILKEKVENKEKIEYYYIIRRPDCTINYITKDAMLECFKQGRNILNAKVQNGVIKAKYGELPVIESEIVSKNSKLEDLLSKTKKLTDADIDADNKDEVKKKKEKSDKQKYGRGICNPKKDFDVCIKSQKDYEVWIKVKDKKLYIGIYAYNKGASVEISKISNWRDIEDKIDVTKYVEGIDSIILQNKLKSTNCTLKLGCLNHKQPDFDWNYRSMRSSYGRAYYNEIVFEKDFNKYKDTVMYDKIEIYGERRYKNDELGYIVLERESLCNTYIKLIGCSLTIKKLCYRALYNSEIEVDEAGFEEVINSRKDWDEYIKGNCEYGDEDRNKDRYHLNKLFDDDDKSKVDPTSRNYWDKFFDDSGVSEELLSEDYSAKKYGRRGTGVKILDTLWSSAVEKEACMGLKFKNFNDCHLAFYIGDGDKISEGLYKGLKLLPGCGRLICGREKDIPCEAFSGSNIDYIVFKKKCKKIGDRAFQNCKDLRHAEIDTEEIGDRAFAGCENLRGVEISEHLEKIHPDAFAGCNKLHTISCAYEEVKELVVEVLSKSKSINVNNIEIRSIRGRLHYRKSDTTEKLDNGAYTYDLSDTTGSINITEEVSHIETKHLKRSDALIITISDKVKKLTGVIGNEDGDTTRVDWNIGKDGVDVDITFNSCRFEKPLIIDEKIRGKIRFVHCSFGNISIRNRESEGYFDNEYKEYIIRTSDRVYIDNCRIGNLLKIEDGSLYVSNTKIDKVDINRDNTYGLGFSNCTIRDININTNSIYSDFLYRCDIGDSALVLDVKRIDKFAIKNINEDACRIKVLVTDRIESYEPYGIFSQNIELYVPEKIRDEMEYTEYTVDSIGYNYLEDFAIICGADKIQYIICKEGIFDEYDYLIGYKVITSNGKNLRLSVETLQEAENRGISVFYKAEQG